MKISGLVIPISYLLSFSNVSGQDIGQDIAADNALYVEIRIGFQGSDNIKFVDHLIGGYDSISHDGKKHYAVSYESNHPIELTIGFEYRKKFRSHLNLNYSKQEMTLDASHYSYQSFEQPYPFASVDMLTIKASGLWKTYFTKRVGIWMGLSTGIRIPIGYSFVKPTMDYFGIRTLKQNTEWLLGCDSYITIPITKSGLYLFPSISVLFPVSGNIGEFEMEQNSEYEAVDPLKVFVVGVFIGIGYKFGNKPKSTF